jgi:antitoxin CptB
MDKLLGAFTKKYINQLNQDELIDLEKLLDIDDTSLYNFFNGIDNEIKFDETNVLKLFKNFKYNNEDS